MLYLAGSSICDISIRSHRRLASAEGRVLVYRLRPPLGQAQFPILIFDLNTVVDDTLCIAALEVFTVGSDWRVGRRIVT